MGRKFSTTLSLLLLVFVGVPLALFMGSLYVVLGKRMTGEHLTRLQTQQVEKSKTLLFRLNEMEAMLQRMSDNNDVKINLILGMRSEVEDIIRHEYCSANGALFFIWEAKDSTIIPEFPGHLRNLKPQVSALCTDNSQSLIFQNDGQGSIYSLLSRPIKKRDGQFLGSAFVVYDLSKDMGFWSGFQTGSLFIKSAKNLINLRTHQSMEMPLQNLNLGAMEFESSLSDLFPDSGVISLEDFEGVYYIVSFEYLVKEKRFWFLILVGICLAIFILSISAALVIAKKLGQPLIGIADQAAKLANNPSDVYLNQEGIKYREFQMLVQAFNGLLNALLHAKEKKLMEQSQEKYRTILENMIEGYYEVDLNGNFTFFNDSMCRILGYTKDELMGMNNQQYMDKKTAREVLRVFSKVYTTEKPSEAFDWEFISKDGTQRHVQTSASLVRDADGQPIGFKGVLLDVTERRLADQEKMELQAQLQRAQKMEAIGTLAGGVAHDLNNILSGLVSYPELLLLEMPEDTPLRGSILTIQKSGEKAAAIVQDLLTLARRGVAVKEVVQLNHTISEYLKSPEHEKVKSFHPHVHVRTNLETNLLNILGSPIHLSKTIMNLVSNAVEAMPGGGTLFISTENRYIDRPIRGYVHVEEGDYVVLTVTDTGVGISSKDMERIFEPFYTKKVMGRSGTGLGMAVVWGTVKDHKGYIDVQSTEGKGTAFTLYFPVTRKEVGTDKVPATIEDYVGKGESILVVDDVGEQREIASRILEKLGYSVTSVSSGERAVRYLKNDSADLLLLDMIMDPGIDGLETYKRIIEFRPGQKALIVSGFSETERVKEAQRLGAGAYIKKPYMLEKIGLAVRDELDE
jgi:PAS domain S-box-containing protein